LKVELVLKLEPATQESWIARDGGPVLFKWSMS